MSAQRPDSPAEMGRDKRHLDPLPVVFNSVQYERNGGWRVNEPDLAQRPPQVAVYCVLW